MLRYHHVMCLCFQYSGYDYVYVCDPTYLHEFTVYLKLRKVHYVRFIGMKHIFIYIYVYHTNVFEADNIYKNLLQMSFDIVLLCLFRSGAPPMTLLTAGVLIALPYPQLTATASSVCTIVTDSWSGAPPNQNPG